MNMLHALAARSVLAKGELIDGTIVGIQAWVTGGGEDSPPIHHEAWAVEGANGTVYGVHQTLHPKNEVRIGMPVQLRVDGAKAVIVWGQPGAEDWKQQKPVPERGIRDDRSQFTLAKFRKRGIPVTVTIGGTRDRKAMLGLSNAVDVIGTVTGAPDEFVIEFRKHPRPFYAAHLFVDGEVLPALADGRNVRIDWAAAALAKPGVGVAASTLESTREELVVLDKLQERIVNPKPMIIVEPGPRPLGKKGEVTWETFIEITQGIVRDSLEGDACDVYAQKFGIPAGEWTAVQMGWLKKLQRNPILAVKYGQAMSAAVRPPG